MSSSASASASGPDIVSITDDHVQDGLMRTDTSILEKFELFPKLPIELRLRIWKFDRSPRTITLQHRQDFMRSIRDGRDLDKVKSVLTQTKATMNPASLFVNQESRLEALKHYKAYIFGGCGRTIFFAPRLYWLQIHPNVRTITDQMASFAYASKSNKSIASDCQFLIFSHSPWHTLPSLAYSGIFKNARSLMEKFRNLSAVVIEMSIKDETREAWWKNDQVHDPHFRQKVIAYFTAVFQAQHERDPRCKVPKVIFDIPEIPTGEHRSNPIVID